MNYRRHHYSVYMNKPTPTVGCSNQILPDSIYMTFNAPAVNEYHRGILLTSTFKPGHDPPSGTLFHAVDPDGPETWQFEVRSVKNIHTSTSLALIYRIGQLIGGPDQVAAQAQQIEKILKEVKFDASAARIARLGTRGVTDGYSCVLWTEDALGALVRKLPPRTFLPSLKFSSKDGTISPEDIVAEANLARKLAGPVEAEMMVGKHVPGEFEVFNRYF